MQISLPILGTMTMTMFVLLVHRGLPIFASLSTLYSHGTKATSIYTARCWLLETAGTGSIDSCTTFRSSESERAKKWVTRREVNQLPYDVCILRRDKFGEFPCFGLHSSHLLHGLFWPQHPSDTFQPFIHEICLALLRQPRSRLVEWADRLIRFAPCFIV